MRRVREIFGAITVFALGSLIFIAPDSMMPSRLAGGNNLVQTANAQSYDPMARYLAKIKADDDYFRANIALEATEQQSQNLVVLKSPENTPAPMRLANHAGDELTTGSIAGNISPEANELAKVNAAYDDTFDAAIANETSGEITEELAKVKAADDDYFDAVIAIETSGENPEDLAKLKAADDAYFNAVIALESANTETTPAKKVGKTVKVAAAGGVQMPAASMDKKAPLPAKAYKAKRKVAKKTRHTPVHMAKVEEKPRHGPISGIINIVVNGVILAPARILSKKSQ